MPNRLPDDSDTGSKIQRTLRLSIVEGGLVQTFLNWTTGSVLIGYMLHYGATPAQIGWVASLPLLSQVVSPFAAYLAGHVGRVKYLVAVSALIGRTLWIVAALLPQLGLPDASIPPLLLLIVALSSLFQSATGTLWASWMGTVVPEERRGRYFGSRAAVVGLTGTAANLAAGAFLDRIAAPLNFQWVLAMAVLLSLLGVLTYLFHYEPPGQTVRHGVRETLFAPWRDRNLRRLLVFGIYWQAAVLLSAPFVIPYFLAHVRMTFTQIAIWSAIASLTALVSNARWGAVADRYGNKAVLAIGTFLAGLLPLVWMLAGPGRLWPIWLGGVLDAFAWGAIGPAIFNLTLASAPGERRLDFIAAFSLATGLAGFVGGAMSGQLFTLFDRLPWSPFGSAWTPYHSLFLLSAALRMSAWVLLRPVQETDAWRTRDVLRQVRFAWRGIGFPWRQ